MDNLQVAQNLRNEIKQLRLDRLELAQGFYDSVFSDEPQLHDVMLKAEKIIEESK